MMSFLTRKHRTHRAALTTIAASLTLALGLAEPVFAADAPAPVWRTDATASVTESHDLIRLVPGGLTTAVKLTGAMPTQYFDFGVRADEIVSKATLDLSFTPSPSLIPGTSQLNVYLNGELQGVTAITKEMLGKPIEIKYQHDPNSGHYQITPYAFMPKVGRKMTPHLSTELGQGVLKVMEEIHQELHPDLKELGGYLMVDKAD